VTTVTYRMVSGQEIKEKREGNPSMSEVLAPIRKTGFHTITDVSGNPVTMAISHIETITITPY
jgi:hypothetical protein